MKLRFCSLPLLLIFAAFPAGCHISRPADPARAATVSLPGPDAWPDRDLAAVEGFSKNTPSEIYTWELNGLVPRDDLVARSRDSIEKPDRVIIDNRLTEHGLLRAWKRQREPIDYTRSLGLVYLGGGIVDNASFLSSLAVTDERLKDRLEEIPADIGQPRRKRSYIWPGLQRTHAAESVLLDAGIEISIPAAPGERGLLVVLGGLMSTTWQESSIELFAKAGWAVIQIDPKISILKPNEDEHRRTSAARSKWFLEQYKSRSAMYQANVAAESPPLDGKNDRKYMDADSGLGVAVHREALERFPIPPTGFELKADTDPAELGRTIAEAIDGALAENAYAAAAAVEYFVETHGSDAVGPIAVLGYSAGSFSAPAVAARLLAEGHAVDAMILLGAGADIFNISQTSALTNAAFNLKPADGPEPSQERIDEAHSAYLDHTRLDPYTLAPALADIPTFLMIADDDKFVPNGELLDQRLQRPHRVRYFGGHGGLFYFLPMQTPRMIRWLDGVVAAERSD